MPNPGQGGDAPKKDAPKKQGGKPLGKPKGGKPTPGVKVTGGKPGEKVTASILPSKIPPLTDKEKRERRRLKQKAQNIVENYRENNMGGAPVDVAFALAALQQGLSPTDIRVILNSQALGGPQTSASYSSAELLDYFTDNPDQIAALLEAVKSTAGLPQDYGEYLAQGGEVGGYRSQDMLQQEAVFGIGGAKEAYFAGTTYQKWLAEGNDPARWYIEAYREGGPLAGGPNSGMSKKALENPQGGGGAAGPGGPSFIGGFDVDQFNALGTGDLGSMATTMQQMFRARQQRDMAQGLYGETFDDEDMFGEEG